MTLREAIALFNFRMISENIPNGMYHENTKTVRIYFDAFDWFEFGIYDFGFEGKSDERVEKILTRELLETKVSSLDHCDEIGFVEIWLEVNEKST